MSDIEQGKSYIIIKIKNKNNINVKSTENQFFTMNNVNFIYYIMIYNKHIEAYEYHTSQNFIIKFRPEYTFKTTK